MNSESEPQYLYVSPDLSFFEVPKRIEPPREFGFEGKQYRRLDPQYYAWLRSRFNLLEKLVDKRKLKSQDWAESVDRFAYIHDWAAKRSDHATLHKIAAETNVRTYQPPRFGVAPKTTTPMPPQR